MQNPVVWMHALVAGLGRVETALASGLRVHTLMDEIYVISITGNGKLHCSHLRERTVYTQGPGV
jgi:hypothetical protein